MKKLLHLGSIFQRDFRVYVTHKIGIRVGDPIIKLFLRNSEYCINKVWFHYGPFWNVQYACKILTSNSWKISKIEGVWFHIQPPTYSFVWTSYLQIYLISEQSPSLERYFNLSRYRIKKLSTMYKECIHS